MPKKKNTKKSKNTSSSSSQAATTTTDDPFEDDTFVKDDDLSISEADTTNISNFISSTNKSFHKLAAAFIESFKGRCALGLGYALISLFDEAGSQPENVIRRLNSIYILYRMPEIETALRSSKSSKKFEIHGHMFSSFFLFVEGENHLKHESTMCKIILCNETSAISNLTVNEFMAKSTNFDHLEVDYAAADKWENENTDFWPPISDDGIPTPILHSAASCPRQEIDASAKLSFDSLMPFVPTVLPKLMPILTNEFIDSAKREKLTEKERALRRLSGKPGDFLITEALRATFSVIEPAIIAYEHALMQDGSDESISNATGPSTSLDTNLTFSPSESDVETCIQKLLEGNCLTPFQTRRINAFLTDASENDPQFKLLLNAIESDEIFSKIINNNSKIAAEIVTRLVKNPNKTTIGRFLDVLCGMEIAVQPMEAMLRLFPVMKDMGNVTEERDKLYAYIRRSLKQCDQSENHRNIRLISNLISKLLKDEIVFAKDLAHDLRPFALKFSSNKDAGMLYQIVTEALLKERYGLP